MDQKFTAKLRAGQDYTFLKLSGVVDEDNHLSSLTERLEASIVVIDMGEVDRINSYGVRDWVNWLGALAQANKQVALVRCSSAIVQQANMVTNFTGEAVIVSFKAPYYCPECDKSIDKLLYTESLLGQVHPAAPDFVCEVCGGPLEFDDFEESYFAFLQGMGPSSVSGRIREIANEMSPGLEKKIQALVTGQLSGPIHTATRNTPPGSAGSGPSGAFPGLIGSASQAQKAASDMDRPTLLEPIKAMAKPPTQPSSFKPARVRVPASTASPPAARPAPSPPKSDTSLLWKLLPVALVMLALLMMLALLVLVFYLT